VKGRQEWKESCIVPRFPSKMSRTPMKTWFASRMIIFQETLENRNVISNYYKQQQAINLPSKVPIFWT
jgi:hypothetical protein